MTRPLISVVLPTYNMGSLVGNAIQSILAQTVTDFELLVINDGSIDETASVLADYAQRDERIVVVHNGENLGLIDTLNAGLGIARGTYIARQDADNRSFPDRFARQLVYLNAHPEVGLVGTTVSVVQDPRQTTAGHVLPDPVLPPALIPWEQLAYPYFAHDTIMARRDVMLDAGGYDLKQIYAEDYDLWVRMSRITQLAMLPKPGARFFWNPEGTSQMFRSAQENTTAAIRSRQQSELLERRVGSEEARLLSKLMRSEIASSDELCRAEVLLDELHTAYLTRYSLTDIENALLESRVKSVFWKAKQTFHLAQFNL